MNILTKLFGPPRVMYYIPFTDKNGIPTGKRLVLPERIYKAYGSPITAVEVKR